MSGKPVKYSRIALLIAILYMELANTTSVIRLVRILKADFYKMKILGLDDLPSESMFSRFKDREDTDRIMILLIGIICEEDEDYRSMVGVDCTGPQASTRTDPGASWGYDHISEEMYYRFKIHLPYDLLTIVPIRGVVTPANMYDITQPLPFLKNCLTNRAGERIIRRYRL